jgi:hypothetical protein
VLAGNEEAQVVVKRQAGAPRHRGLEELERRLDRNDPEPSPVLGAELLDLLLEDGDRDAHFAKVQRHEREDAPLGLAEVDEDIGVKDERGACPRLGRHEGHGSVWSV